MRLSYLPTTGSWHFPFSTPQTKLETPRFFRNFRKSININGNLVVRQVPEVPEVPVEKLNRFMFGK
jgi:hypothetical protein